jgi:predicted acyltransferase
VARVLDVRLIFPAGTDGRYVYSSIPQELNTPAIKRKRKNFETKGFNRIADFIITVLIVTQ